MSVPVVCHIDPFAFVFSSPKRERERESMYVCVYKRDRVCVVVGQRQREKV